MYLFEKNFNREIQFFQYQNFINRTVEIEFTLKFCNFCNFSTKKKLHEIIPILDASMMSFLCQLIIFMGLNTDRALKV